jgi:hypothetical protein
MLPCTIHQIMSESAFSCVCSHVRPHSSECLFPSPHFKALVPNQARQLTEFRTCACQMSGTSAALECDIQVLRQSVFTTWRQLQQTVRDHTRKRDPSGATPGNTRTSGQLLQIYSGGSPRDAARIEGKASSPHRFNLLERLPAPSRFVCI